MLAQTLGQVYIITNSTEGWVELSTKKYLPAALPALEGIKVVSARSRFADQLPGSPGEWKLHAFLELERVFDAEATPNLISIGDAVHEITAAKVLGRKLASAMVKTVRLRDVPKPRLLLQEVRFLTRQLKGFVDLSGNMHVSL